MNEFDDLKFSFLQENDVTHAKYISRILWMENPTQIILPFCTAFIRTIFVVVFLFALPFFSPLTLTGNSAISGENQVLLKRKENNAKPNSEIIPKPYPAETTLLTENKLTCVLFVPEDESYKAAAQQLAQAFSTQFGMTPKICSRLQDIDMKKETVIALGQMINNKLIERLYWSRYVYADSLFPGKDGFVVQTVHNPYSFTEGQNIIVLACSTPAGAKRVCEYFGKMLPTLSKDGKIGYLLRVELPEKRETRHVIGSKNYASIKVPESSLSREEIKKLSQSPAQPTLLAFHDLALKYMLTGEMPYLEAAKRVLETMSSIYEKTPSRAPTWPEECNSFYIFTLWDAVEDAPVFNSGERLRFSNMLLKFLKAVAKKVTDYKNVDTQPIIHNHQSFPLLGLYAGSRYFIRNFELPADDKKLLNEYLNKAAISFGHQAESWKPLCDADYYLTLTIGHTMIYGLAEGKMTFFENDNIRKYADYLIGICDNRGWSSGFGDSNVAFNSIIVDAGAPLAFWYTKDARYLGYLNIIHDGNWPNPYHQNIPSMPPDNIIGVKVFNMSRPQYNYTVYGGSPSGTPNIPYEQSFDKISFRQNIDPLGQYFVLDGYSRGVHMHFDGNAILKLTNKGEDWLIDGDYLVNNTTEHNMISILRNGRAEKPMPECAGIAHFADLPAFAMTETWLKDYNGIDWRRDILWKKGSYIAIFDRCKAIESADYKLDCIFKCLDHGNEEITDSNTFRISRQVATDDSQKTKQPCYMYISNADGAKLSLIKRKGSSGPIKCLRQTKSASIRAGEEISFVNLVSFTGEKDNKPPVVRRISDTVIIAELESPVLLGAKPYNGSGISINAAIYSISPQIISLCDATSLSIDGSVFSATVPVSVEIDLIRQKATVTATASSTVKLPGLNAAIQVSAGKQEIVLENCHEIENRIRELLKNSGNNSASQTERNTNAAPETTGMRKLWQLGRSENKINDFTAVDLYRNGKMEILVCRGNELQCYESTGNLLWKFTAQGVLRSVITADMEGKGILSILCGGEDENLYILDSSGKIKNKHKFTERLVTGQGGTKQPFVNCLLAEDVDADGKVEIFAGLNCSQITALDSDLKQLWNIDSIYHGARKLGAADMNGDGKKEILISDHYGSVSIITADGKKRTRTFSQLGDTCFDTGDINGDHRIEMVNASTGGGVKVFNYSVIPLFGFFNYGYGVNEVKINDFDHDGALEIVVAGDTGYLYLLDGSGKVKRKIDFGDAITSMCLINDSGTGMCPSVVVGQRNGSILAAMADGNVIASFQAEGPSRIVSAVDLDSDGKKEIIAVDSENQLFVLSPCQDGAKAKTNGFNRNHILHLRPGK